MRLIDADKLKAEGYRLQRYITDFYTSAYEIMPLDDVPTIEAKPNGCKYWDSESHFCALRRSQAEPKHGRWKQTKAYPNIIFCDECGEPFEKSNSSDKWNYCPNCGTKMEDN